MTAAAPGSAVSSGGASRSQPASAAAGAGAGARSRTSAARAAPCRVRSAGSRMISRTMAISQNTALAEQSVPLPVEPTPVEGQQGVERRRALALSLEVRHGDVGDVGDREAEIAGTETEVGLLGIEEEPFVPPPGALEALTRTGEKGSGRPIRRGRPLVHGRIDDGLSPCRPPPGPAGSEHGVAEEPEHRLLATKRRDEGSVAAGQPWDGDPDPGHLQRRDQGTHHGRRHLDVDVHDDQGVVAVARRRRDAGVDAGRVAGVATHVDHRRRRNETADGGRGGVGREVVRDVEVPVEAVEPGR